MELTEEESLEGASPERAVDEHNDPVMILVYNGWNDVRRTLSWLSAKDRSRVWILDNGSEAVVPPEVIAAKIGRYVRLEANLGFAGGFNRGLRQAHSEGYGSAYLLNSDAFPERNAVRSAMKALRNNPLAAAVGSVALDDTGRDVLFDGDWAYGLPRRGRTTLPSRSRRADYLNGAGLAIRLSSYFEIGPMYEPYFLYHEETDWCFRARAAGWHLLVDPGSIIRHGDINQRPPLRQYYYRARNSILACRRGVRLQSSQPPSIWGAVAKIGGELKGKSRDEKDAMLNGLADGLTGRFGPRREEWPKPILMALELIVSPVARTGRKLQLGWNHLQAAQKFSTRSASDRHAS